MPSASPWVRSVCSVGSFDAVTRQRKKRWCADQKREAADDGRWGERLRSTSANDCQRSVAAS